MVCFCRPATNSGKIGPRADVIGLAKVRLLDFDVAPDFVDFQNVRVTSAPSAFKSVQSSDGSGIFVEARGVVFTVVCALADVFFMAT